VVCKDPVAERFRSQYELISERKAELFARVVKQAIDRAKAVDDFEAVPSIRDKARLYMHSRSLQRALFSYGLEQGITLQTYRYGGASVNGRPDTGPLMVRIVSRDGENVQEPIETGPISNIYSYEDVFPPADDIDLR
jgi:hypothetical protein